MWRNFGALMGAVSKITGPRVIQPGSVITRRTRDPRVPPVVFNFSVCSCTYLYVCVCVCVCMYMRASTCKHGRSRTVFCTVFLAIYRNGTKRRPISRCFCIRLRGGRAFSTRRIVNPSITCPFSPPDRCTDQTISRPILFFLRIKRGKF